MNKDYKQRITDFKVVFGNDAGKRVLEYLIGQTTLSHSCVAKGKPIDMNRVLYNEAQRAMILHIVNLIGKNPYEQRQERVKE